MAKTKGIYTCDACGAQHLKWQGQCPDCGKWNALSETQLNLRKGSQSSSRALSVESTRLDSLDIKRVERSSSVLSELDRVLVGWLVPGSFLLFGVYT